MTRETAIPHDVHARASSDIRTSLGSFWDTVFQESGLVDAITDSKAMGLAQAELDSAEALAARDHRVSPAYHREHWYPVVLRKSRRNSVSAATIGMPDTPVMGGQTEGSVYLDGEVFQVGTHQDYSKVVTYPLPEDCGLVSVRTCITDSISSPAALLIPGRDFFISGGVVAIRSEKDPFSSGNFRVEPSADDSLVTLWCCDAELDHGNVARFIGYPLGLHVPSTATARDTVAALWDSLAHGTTEAILNTALGLIFGVPVIQEDSVVQQVEPCAPAGTCKVVTDKAVYLAPTGRLAEWVNVGAKLRRGDFITTDVAVRSRMSHEDVDRLISDGGISRLTLPPGAVYGVDAPITVESRTSRIEAGGWFKLNAEDTDKSAFWHGVLSKTDPFERLELVSRIAKESPGESLADFDMDATDWTVRGTVEQLLETHGVEGHTAIGTVDQLYSAVRELAERTGVPFAPDCAYSEIMGVISRLLAISNRALSINPLKAFAYPYLANTILVETTKGLGSDAIAKPAFDLLRRLVPSYARLQVIQTVGVEDGASLESAEDTVEHHVATPCASEDYGLSSDDSLSLTFIPIDILES